jgi:hypothetical protein
MQNSSQKHSATPVELKVDGVKEGSLRVHPGIVAKADAEIVMYPAQVPIALDVAAAYRNGHFLPHLALLLQPHLRPEGELPRVTLTMLNDQRFVRLRNVNGMK